MEWVKVCVASGLGLLLGSFINALVWRLHEQGAGYEDEPTEAKKPSQDELSILKGRSMCPNCRHTLHAKDLVPVLSWLTLGGKCRYCRKPISWQYPLVELLMAILFGISWLFLPELITHNYILLFAYYFLLVVGTALAVYDAKWFLLPNRLMYPFQAIVAVFVVSMAYVKHDMRMLATAGLSALCFYALFRLIHDGSKGQWLGYGDVRLAIALGLLAGTLPKMFLLLFIASLTGTIVSLPGVIQRGRKRGLSLHVSFGPFLLIATFAVMLWGQKAIDWYLAYLG